MAPKLINKTINSKDEKKNILKYQQIKKTIKDYQKFIKNNFDYVGDNFPHKARSVHYNKKNNKKGIYGNASAEEIKELKEEGIETETIPWINDSEN